MTTPIQSLLTQIKQSLLPLSETPALDAQVLVAHYLSKPRSWVLAHPEAPLDEEQHNQIVRAAERLKHGEPLPYVIGHWEFYGQDYQLSPDVLIPRPETELLVELSLDWLHQHPQRRKVIDVGTGSGCIAIALAMNIPDLHALLTDISSPALQVARMNAQKFALLDRLDFIQADLLDGIIERFDLVCANLPYIPTATLRKLPVSKKEPRLALDGGRDGLQLIAMLLNQATNRVTPGGMILLEIESSQSSLIKSMAESLYPAATIRVLKDLSGQDRCLEIVRSNLILHLCQRREWLVAQEMGEYTAQSLQRVGFIHCSLPEQMLQVANHFYQDTSDMVTLWIDPAKITAEIRWEFVDGAHFPHIVGPIDLPAVVAVTDLIPDIDGCYRYLKTPD